MWNIKSFETRQTDVPASFHPSNIIIWITRIYILIFKKSPNSHMLKVHYSNVISTAYLTVFEQAHTVCGLTMHLDVHHDVCGINFKLFYLHYITNSSKCSVVGTKHSISMNSEWHWPRKNITGAVNKHWGQLICTNRDISLHQKLIF